MTLIKERFPYSTYELRERRHSRIAKNVTHIVPVGVECPRCETPLPMLEHGKSQACLCDLRMTRWGNALDCEIEEV